MATVYLARDLRHRRAVALKVLHPELSAALGPERFLQEIELTASLQHPHILPLFDSGEAAGLLYYVMPYVDGESLRDRLARERQLGVDEAVRITREVASALDYAHRHGVIHRDVKPENILLHDGAALVADFGIALAVAHASGERITQSGFSLGTPQYMAPEQAMAEREIDARTDIFALGVVLYEMLAGEPPFTGPTAQAVVARVMTDRPRSLAALRETVPSHIEATVMTALAKLPADRFASVAAFAAALAPSGATPSAPVVVPPSRPSRHAPPHMIAAVAAGALAVGAALGWSLASARGRATASSAPAQGPVRFAIDIDSGVLGSSGWWTSAPAISPDGRTIVYAVSGADGLRLYARSLNDVAARPLAGTEDADGPFFSPDGAWVAFGSRGALRKVQVSGGAPITVTAVPSPDQFFSGHWGPGDTIIYSAKPSGALYRVPAGGGTPTRIAVADTSRRLAHPHLLPGGRSLLVTVVGSTWSVGRIGVLELASGRLHQLGPGTGARYAAGHLLYASAGGALYKQAFDLGALTPRANPVEIASGLDVVFAASSAFDVAVNGTLVYRVSAGRSKLTLTDRAGQEQRVLPGSVPWAPQFSPDGRRIAYAASGRGPDPGDVWAADVWPNDVWITDLASGATERITTDGNDNNEPTWTRDGTALAYSSARLPDAKDIFLRTLDGARTRRVVRRPGLQYPSDFAVDGRTLLFDDEPPGGTQDIWLQPLDGAAARPYLATRANEYGAHFSPDGRWVAYVSDETGRSEVYLQAYPIPGRRVVVTTSGGEVPVWKRDGRALYYWQGDQLIVASLGARPGELPAVRNRTTLFRAPLADPSKGYDVTADGSRFAMIIGAPRANRLVVALDALGEVRPAKRTER
jgi:serine/threonine-protein kinase